MQTISLHNLLLPDAWQAEATHALRAGIDAVVDAPTGAGKTYIFEKFLETARLSGQAIYTAPTRALANDKYLEWSAKNWNVGIATGDISIHTDAPVLVATLESVMTAALRNSPPSLVVIDEYQWIHDEQRGNHYEGFLIQLPTTTRLLLLSGSVANPEDVVQWLNRLGRNAKLIQHKERPVPLEEIDLDSLLRDERSPVQAYWSARVAAALRHHLGPILIFAPQRKDAERMAKKLARDLPQTTPLKLSPEQEKLLDTDLAKTLPTRIAWHHSGLSYAQRAGVIEPLAKAGQLRVVVATLGLSAGINFSLRSVLVSGQQYQADGLDRFVQPHELLQMMGRAGRRGLDETGYFLITSSTPRMNQARPFKLRRAAPLPWNVLLSATAPGASIEPSAQAFPSKLFTEKPLSLGLDSTPTRPPDAYPCGQRTDTGRARLVSRKTRPFRGCTSCSLKQECLTLNPEPTLLWQWQRIGILDRELRLTQRGQIVSFFSAIPGLAIAAAIEEKNYNVQDILFDLGDLFAGERFHGEEHRWSGRLAMACQRIYGRFSIEGYLTWGVPSTYGHGAAEVVRQLIGKSLRKRQATGELTGVGDIDRLLTEWRSLLKQIAAAPACEHPSWPLLQKEAADCLAAFPASHLPNIPPLTAEQRKAVDFSWSMARA